MQWNATLYDKQHDFVSKYGESLIELLQPKAGEKILDLGCGTGDLTYQVSSFGCVVIGIDASQEMIVEAKAKYPGIKFLCEDACSFSLNEKPAFARASVSGGHSLWRRLAGKYDAVFSNAALHWIKDQDAVLKNVFRHLKKGGRFVAEMGAKGNVEKIINGIRYVLLRHGFEKQTGINKWYFPSEAEYAALLEKQGFEIRFITSYDRPTVLKNTEKGIVEWLEMFGTAYFKGISDKEKQKLLREIQDHLWDDLYHDGTWIADYKRLRFCAFKR